MPFDRRKYIRYETEMPAELRLEGGYRFRVTLLNISLAGLQLNCDGWVADRVLPADKQVKLGQPIGLGVQFDLAEKKGPATTPIKVDCEIVNATRKAQDDYLLGLRYVAIDNPTYRLLEAFITRRMHPGTG